MKKIIFTLVMLIVAMSANADGLDRLARKYKKCRGAVYAASIDELDKLDTPSCVNVVIEKDGDKVDGIKKIITKMKEKGVRKMRVLQLGDCSFKDKARFADDAYDAVPSAYEGFINLGDEDGRFSIYIQKRKGYLKILMLMTGEDNSGFIEVESDNSTLNSLFNFD